MPKHNWPLSKQTKAALDKIVQEVADKMDVSDDYLYAIRAGYKNDPYAYFRPLFRGTALVDVSRADVWLDELTAIREEAAGKVRARLGDVQDADLSRALNEVISARLDNASYKGQLLRVREAMRLLKRREVELVGAESDGGEDSRGGGESPERVDTQEAGSHGRTPAAASGLEDGFETEEGEQLADQSRAAGGDTAVSSARLVGVTHAAVGANGGG